MERFTALLGLNEVTLPETDQEVQRNMATLKKAAKKAPAKKAAAPAKKDDYRELARRLAVEAGWSKRDLERAGLSGIRA